MLGENYGHALPDPDYDPRFDHDGDGAVGVADYTSFGSAFGGNPGPSALACAPPSACGP
jgi:hypothetical protein